ncbi:hypothetical protein BDV34DRAFT_207274 [Aspergillus parasiticus]|uniref:Uncharacterized protein n=1 Tax=Aspergillus parasiticus TaxID=5067 RepID=A0A5N6D1T8_ASPPA|nr:hypothetical protein BDV34DRAFT_207274 [Aspergillus parasiticus]
MAHWFELSETTYIGFVSTRMFRKEPESRICELGTLTRIIELCPGKRLTYHRRAHLFTRLRMRVTFLEGAVDTVLV